MKDCFTTGSPRLSQCCVSPPSAEIAEGSEKETRPAGRRRTRECRVLCVNRTEETGGEARPRNTRTHAHTRWMTPGSGAGCKGTLKIRMDEDQILAHGAVRRNCATGPLKLDCHSGIDQQSDDRDGGPHEQESRAQAKYGSGSDEMEQKPKHMGRPRVRSLRKLKAHSLKKVSPLSMQCPGPQLRNPAPLRSQQRP